MAKKNFSNVGAQAAEAFFSRTDETNMSEDIREVDEKQGVVKSKNTLHNPLIAEFKNDVNNFEKSMTKTFNFKRKDLDNIVMLSDRFLGLRKRVNQSEVIRMGISLLMRLNDDDLLRELDSLDRAMIGRKSTKKIDEH